MCIFANFFRAKHMQQIKRHNRRNRILVLLFLFSGGMLPNVFSVSGENFIRLNADVSYARDMARASVGAPFIEELPISQALEWIGSGRYESLKASNGLAPAVGFGYRYQHKALIIDLGLGVEYRYRFNRMYPINEVLAAETDEKNWDFEAHYAWKERQGRLQHLGINLPFMVGGEWSGICVLAGVKANMDVWGKGFEKGLTTKYGVYPQTNDPVYIRDKHGFFTDKPYQGASVASAMQWNIRACLELGYRLSKAPKGKKAYKQTNDPRYYVSLFAEYGFVGSQNTYLPLLVGARFTALLPIPEKPSCKCLKF